MVPVLAGREAQAARHVGLSVQVEDPGDVRKAVERGLRAVAGGQVALLDIRLKPVEQIVERGEG